MCVHTNECMHARQRGEAKRQRRGNQGGGLRTTAELVESRPKHDNQHTQRRKTYKERYITLVVLPQEPLYL